MTANGDGLPVSVREIVYRWVDGFDGPMVLAERVYAAVAPPADLPATVGGVADAQAVCEAAGLAWAQTAGDGASWTGESVRVTTSNARAEVSVYAGTDHMRWFVNVEFGGPTATLWQAIRDAQRSETDA